MTGAAYSTGTGWWNDADGKAGTLRAEGHPQEANLLSADLWNGTVSDGTTSTLMAHKVSYSANTMPHVVQDAQAFVKAKRASSVVDDDTWREEPVSPTLNAFDNGSETRSTVLFVQPGETVSATGTTSHALTAASSKGTTEDGTGRGVPIVAQPAFRLLAFGYYVNDDTASALKARDYKDATDLVVVEPSRNVLADGAVVNALLANMGGAGGGACVDDAQGNRLVVVQVGQSPSGDTDTAGTLGGAGATGGFRFDLETCGAYVVVDEVAKTLTTGNHRFNPEHETFVVQTPETFAFQPADQILGKGALRAVRTDVAPTIALGDHHSDRGLRIVQQAPVAFSVREDATNNSFHANQTDTALCVNALRPSPQSHHAQLFIVQGEEPTGVPVVPLAFSAGNAAEAYGLGISENIAPPLRAAASGSNQVPTVLYQDSQYGVEEYDTAGTLRAGRIPEHQMVVTEVPHKVEPPALVRMREGAPGGGKGPLVSENVSLTLATSNDQVLFQPVAFTVKGNGEAWTQDMVTGITAGGGLPGQGYPAVIQPIAFTQNQREEVRDLGGIAAGLTAEHGTHQQTYIAQPVADDER